MEVSCRVLDSASFFNINKGNIRQAKSKKEQLRKTKQQQYLGNNSMPKRQPSKILEQSDSADPQKNQILPSPSVSNSSHTNLHNQAFILYSDQDIVSNSQQSSFVMSQRSSRLSKYSSFSSIDNLNRQKRQHDSILGRLSPSRDESFNADLHLSECSDSGISLIKGLGPLFENKTFSRKSERIAVHLTQGNSQQKQPNLTTSNHHAAMEQLDSEMIEDEKPSIGPTLKHQHNSSKIIQENFQQNSNLFATSFSRAPLFQNPQIIKTQQPNTFSRLTRSSKKLIQQETETSPSNNRQEQSNAEHQNRNKISNSEHIAEITKQYILRGRKEKKIKKFQQKIFNYGLKGYKKQSKTFRRE